MDINEKISTTINALLLVLDRLGGRGDFHKLFKILYFADQKHLLKYGTPITGDNYIAMTNGPVPSMTYDILKALRGQGLLETYKNKFDVYFNLLSKYEVEPNSSPDLTELSESEIQCINDSVAENKDLNFDDLSEKSHDCAWQKAEQDGEISIQDIALAGGANQELLNYINDTIENQRAVFE